MYYYLSYESETNHRIKIWEIIETRSQGWVRLSWIYTKDNGVLAPRQNAAPGEYYTGRLVRVVTQEGIPVQTVKILSPMGAYEWVYADFAQTLEEIQ